MLQYIRMTTEEWKKQLAQEKYTEIWVKNDSSGFVYELHSHPVDTVHIVCAGSMVVNTNGAVRQLQAGDRWEVSKHTPHGSTIGPEGCTYLTGIRM